MSDFDRNVAARGGFADRAVAVDAGLRAHMLRVYNYMTAAVALTGVVVAVYQLDEVRTRTKLPRAGAVTSLAVMLAAVAGGFILDQGLSFVFQRALLAGVVTFAAAGVIALLLPFIERLFGTVTALSLLEWRDPTKPLLQLLAREAPGTYYHSVSVGNLAESAAEAIGADALLLRVASYYHDIGKTVRPFFYTDNQSDRENVHNELDPRTSAQIICEHVGEGVRMARAAGLPRQIVL